MAPMCQTPGLVVWLDTQGNGTAGSTYYTLEFTNFSGHACNLNGYPYVDAISITGALIGGPASFNKVHTPAMVTIANGATAVSVLKVVDTGVFPVASCRPVRAAGLRVYPPNQTRSKNVPFPSKPAPARRRCHASVEAVQK